MVHVHAQCCETTYTCRPVAGERAVKPHILTSLLAHPPRSLLMAGTEHVVGNNYYIYI